METPLGLGSFLVAVDGFEVLLTEHFGREFLMTPQRLSITYDDSLTVLRLGQIWFGRPLIFETVGFRGGGRSRPRAGRRHHLIVAAGVMHQACYSDSA